ncbi:unnamed protein product, partial [Rotaria magnacalcarata]
NLQTKDLDSTSVNKLTNKSNNNEISSKAIVDREQETTIPFIDPVPIKTIHCTKGAIDTVCSQIIELRHDVDQLRNDVNTNQTKTLTFNSAVRRISKSEISNQNQTSVSHHHNVEQGATRKRSSLCIII